MLNLTELTAQENLRQKNTLNLIASENYPSPQVLELMGTVWMNKYAEGQPGKRYYAGSGNVDLLEIKTMELALEVFNASGYGCNVQILSGSPANATVFHSALEPGDLVLSLSLDEGGHLSHMHSTSVFNKYFDFAHYKLVEVEPNSFEIDLEDLQNKLIQSKPKLVIFGFSSYPKQIDFPVLIKLCHDHGVLVLADVAHINGLIAAGLHPTPFADNDTGADFVTMTTHKTLRGPRSGIIFAKDRHMKSVNRTIFPGSFGGPHMQQIAALAQALQEIIGNQEYPDGRSFEQYSKDILANCKMLENELRAGGLEIISPTQTHMCLVKLPADIDSLEIQQKLEKCGIITNRNMLPKDTKTPWRPSGLRLGSAALTSRGADTNDFKTIAHLITDIVLSKISEKEAGAAVSKLAQSLKWYYR